MEKYTMFMDRKNQYSENEYTIFALFLKSDEVAWVLVVL